MSKKQLSKRFKEEDINLWQQIANDNFGGDLTKFLETAANKLALSISKKLDVKAKSIKEINPSNSWEKITQKVSDFEKKNQVPTTPTPAQQISVYATESSHKEQVKRIREKYRSENPDKLISFVGVEPVLSIWAFLNKDQRCKLILNRLLSMEVTSFGDKFSVNRQLYNDLSVFLDKTLIGVDYEDVTHLLNAVFYGKTAFITRDFSKYPFNQNLRQWVKT
jgi:hypothetical protein